MVAMLCCLLTVVTSASAQDSASRLACSEFAKTMQDANDGILTNQEFREALKRINDNARLSTSADIREAGVNLLRAATRRNDQEKTLWVLRMVDACQAVK
jgi:hypothetical protein